MIFQERGGRDTLGQNRNKSCKNGSEAGGRGGGEGGEGGRGRRRKTNKEKTKKARHKTVQKL